MVLGAVLDVRLVELRPEQVAARGGGAEVAGEEQRHSKVERHPAELRVPRGAGGESLRRVDPAGPVIIDG